MALIWQGQTRYCMKVNRVNKVLWGLLVPISTTHIVWIRQGIHSGQSPTPSTPISYLEVSNQPQFSCFWTVGGQDREKTQVLGLVTGYSTQKGSHLTGSWTQDWNNANYQSTTSPPCLFIYSFTITSAGHSGHPHAFLTPAEQLASMRSGVYCQLHMRETCLGQTHARQSHKRWGRDSFVLLANISLAVKSLSSRIKLLSVNGRDK